MKYMLISVIDRKIETKKFKTLEEAKDTMAKEIASHMTPDDMCIVHEMSAYTNTNCDWLIEKLDNVA